MDWLSTTATVSMKTATLDDNVVTSPPMYASLVDSINRPSVHQYQPNQTAALKHAAQAAAKRISSPTIRVIAWPYRQECTQFASCHPFSASRSLLLHISQ